MDTISVPFGDWLQGELDRRGWSISDLARAINAAPAVVSRWRSGARRPRPDQCRKIAAALMIDPLVVLYYAGHVTQLPQPMRHYERDRELRRLAARLHASERVLRTLQAEEVNSEEGIAVRYFGVVPAVSLRWVAGEGGEEMRRVPAAWLGSRAPSAVFVVTASGDCLAGCGITDGTNVLLVHDNNREPRDAEIVLVRVGDEYSLKVWHRKGDWIELRTGVGEIVARLSILADYAIIGFYQAHWGVVDQLDEYQEPTGER